MIKTPYNSCSICGNFLSPDAIFGYGQCYNCGNLGQRARRLKEQEAQRQYAYNDEDEDEDEEDEEEEEEQTHDPNKRYKIEYDYDAMKDIDLTAASNEIARLLDMNPNWVRTMLDAKMPIRRSLTLKESSVVYWKLHNNGIMLKFYEDS